jgi:glucosamine-6-phosphate deaminase
MSTVESVVRRNNIEVRVFKTKEAMGAAAATLGAEMIRKAIADRNEANIIVATGASQFEMLAHLVQQPGISWNCVNAFHLDEYVGLPLDHVASFRLYLWQRFVSRLPIPLKAFHYINAEMDVASECLRLGQIVDSCHIDVAFVGIGENAHLAFNDPPADFETVAPYLVVELDEACRQQQHGEGWFPTLDDVPNKAVTMSINKIMKSRSIICTVPDSRKAAAVSKCLNGGVTPSVPASILQLHEQVTMFLDEPAAMGLSIG